MTYDNSVFFNCPFDEKFASVLEVMIFCVVRAGMTPRLATERVEGGESRLDKIIELIGKCRYSIHDLSLAYSSKADEAFRMNMPFEFGLDLGRRRAPDPETNNKKFLIFERKHRELKPCLSDIDGFDVEHHNNDFKIVIEKLRNFLCIEAAKVLPGPSKIYGDYITFLGWMTEKEIEEGLTEKEALKVPTQERLQEMIFWMKSGMPTIYVLG